MQKRLSVSLWLIVGVVVLAYAMLPTAYDITGGEMNPTMQQTNKSSFTRAPELQGEVWLNGAPTTFQALRGQVVLVDFWTFG